MIHKSSGIPLVAKLQSAPDSAWSDLLDTLEEARGSYDPETQTGGLALQAGDSMRSRTSSSGRAIALTAEDEGKGLMLGREGKSRSHPASASGGASPYYDDGKSTLPDREGKVQSLRAFSSGRAGPFTDGGKDTPVAS